MSAISDYLEGELITHLFGTASYTAADPVYVALYTTAPADAGGGTEVTGGGYARVSVQTGADTGWTISGGAAENTGIVDFGTSTAAWGTVLAAAILDASSGGNFLWHGTLAASKNVGSGDAFRFNAGDLDVTID